MFITSDPLELMNEFANTGQANFHQWHTVYARFPRNFFVGIWGNNTKIAIFLGNEQAVRKAVVESVEACLTSLTYFQPSEHPHASWTMSNIVKIFDWYSPHTAQPTLVFEDDAGRQSLHPPNEQPVTEKLVWCVPARRELN